MIENKIKPFVLFLLFLVCGGVISIALKFEHMWDFANYHYYNPWAFLNNRVNYDIAVAGINAYYSPFADIPLYYLIKYFNDYPNLIYFAQGLWFGALGFVMFKVSELFFADVRKVLFALLLGLSGYAVFFQIGTSTNEIMLSCFVMLSLYLLLREIFILRQGRYRIFLLAGLIAGVALGLKLTSIIYVLPLGLSLICFAKNIPHPTKNIGIFVLGGLIGFLLIDGIWLWKMQVLFGNPFFPFLNKFFQSEYFEIRNYTDERFLPKSLADALLLPFHWAFNTFRADGNTIAVDFRWAVLFVLAFIAAGRLFYKKEKPKAETAFLIVFTLLSYCFWIKLFAIGRYMVVLELCSAILAVKAIVYLLPRREKVKTVYWQVVSALFFVAMLTPIFSQIWGCRNCVVDNNMFSQFVAVDGVKIPDNTLLMFYNYPSAALLPYFSGTADNIRGVSIKQKNYLTADGETDVFNAIPKWKKAKEDALNSHKGLRVAVFAVEDEETIEALLKTDDLLKGMVCKRKRSNIIPSYHFCVAADKQSEIFK